MSLPEMKRRNKRRSSTKLHCSQFLVTEQNNLFPLLSLSWLLVALDVWPQMINSSTATTDRPYSEFYAEETQNSVSCHSSSSSSSSPKGLSVFFYHVTSLCKKSLSFCFHSRFWTFFFNENLCSLNLVSIKRLLLQRNKFTHNNCSTKRQ